MSLPRYCLPISLVLVLHALLLLILLRPQQPVAAPAEQIMEVVMVPPVQEQAPPQPPEPQPQPPKPQPKTPAPSQPVHQTETPTPVPPPVVPAPQTAISPPPPPPVAIPVEAPPPVLTPPRIDASFKGNAKPEYPRTSKALGETGTVRLRIFVNPDGSVRDDVQVEKSSGFARLDAAAVKAVKQWKGMPAKRGSDSVGMWYSLPIVFALDD